MVLRENYELFHSLLGVMSIRCYFMRVTKYFLRQWAYRYVVNRHLCFFINLMTSLPSPFLLTSFCLRHLLTWSVTQDEQVVTCIALINIRCPVLLPLLSCNDVQWSAVVFAWIYIGQATFEGYTAEVIFQSFKRHLMTITCRVSTPNGGFGECIFTYM